MFVVQPALLSLFPRSVLLGVAVLLLAGCSGPEDPAVSASAASATVQQANAAVAASTDLADPEGFANARRGLLAEPGGQIRDAAGKLVWDFDSFAFVKDAAPDTVNPSLWRMARLNNIAGLFKVSDGIYQVRGFDLANMTLIEGESGWIVVDALTSRETAAAALAFAREHLGPREVSALVITHSHIDHFGGAAGLFADGQAGDIPVVVPEGFMQEATSENVLVGTAMGRRAGYMYGSLLPRDATGAVDTGLGKAVAHGAMGLLEPTIVIANQQPYELTMDGVRFIFYPVPGSEAPAEMVFALPDLQAFCGAEIMGHTLHNIYTPRGAKVRDALKWADYLDQALEWSADAEVVFNVHHWPVWGRDNIEKFIGNQRDTYKYIHDQTVRMINQGMTAAEIADAIRLPASLQDDLSVRGYYGTLRHNAMAVYQFYMGWFDANPANLSPLSPVDAARGYVALAGGPEPLQAAAQQAYDQGNYRWAAELLKHAVYADSENAQASELLARSFEQMGYMAESPVWRNFYLTGARELRDGPPEQGLAREAMLGVLQYTPIESFLQAMAASLNGPKAEGVELKINLIFSDLQQSYVLTVKNAVLNFRQAAPADDANASLTLSKPLFLQMVTGSAGATDLLFSDQASIKGSRIDLGRFFALLDKAPGNFPIVTRAQ
jgi:alkyl sulfatase BDS1-like metallo-beta-lactamase superfamily hydrolase